MLSYNNTDGEITQKYFQMVLLLAACLLTVITLWLYSQDGFLNLDAILYLDTADKFVQGQWFEAYKTYRWPFYPFIIAVTHQITGFNLEQSAYITNYVLQLIALIGFLNILKLLGADKRALLFGLVIFLIHPGFNELRVDVIREHGYWAFLIWGVYFFLSYLSTERIFMAFGWGVAMLLAFLFRPEALLVLVILPVVVFFVANWRKQKQIKHFFILNWLIPFFAISLMLVYLSPYDYFLKRYPIRLMDYLTYFDYLLAMPERFQEKANLLETVSLDWGSTSDIIVLLVWNFIENFIENNNIVYLALFCLGLYYSAYSSISRVCHVTFSVLAVILCLIPIGLLSTKFYLSGRITLTLSLVVMSYLPFVLVTLLQEWRKGALPVSKQNFLFPVTVASLFAVAVAAFISFGPSLNYIVKANSWIKQNLPEHARLVTNAHRVSNIHGKNIELVRKQAFMDSLPHLGSSFDYLIVKIKAKKPEFRVLVLDLFGSSVKEFSNARGDSIMIFQLSSTSPS